MLYNYFKIAWRNIRKNNVSTAINVLGLATGVSACLVIYLIAGYDLSFDTFHPGKERIYRAVMDVDDFSGGKFHLSGIPYPAARTIRDHFSGVEKVAAYVSYAARVTIRDQDGNDETKKEGKKFDFTGRDGQPSDIIVAEPAYFDIFPYEWLAGNAIILLNTPDNDSTGTGIRNVLAEKIRELPGVEEVSVDGQQPAVSDRSESAYLKRLGNGVEVLADRRIADAHFIPLYDIKILAGHNLSGRVNDSFPEFLINETCARQLGFMKPEEAIGQLVQVGFLGYSGTNKPTGPVIGVVADFHTRSLYEPIGPTFMTPSKNFVREILSVRLATPGNGTSYFKGCLSQIEKVWQKVYPGEKFDYTFYDEYLARIYTKEQKTAQIINAAMAISIFISCMGLFGIVTFTAEQRTKELGIRKVLGANIANIVTMLSIDFLKPVGLSILIASPIAWWFMNKWLESFAYRIPFSWWIFALAGAAALFIALITVSLRAIKAALANPIENLRSE